MDFYRNLSLVTGGGGGGGGGNGNGGFPSQEQLVVSPSSTTYSKLGVVSSSCSSLDDLFSNQNMEHEAGDVNIEWLSNLVEDCLSNTGNCTYPPLPITPAPPSLQNFPTGDTKTKRKRSIKLPRKPLSSSSTSGWSSHQEEKDLQNQNHVVMTTSSSEYMTPLLVHHQAYWLADSELIDVPQNENTNNTGTTTTIDEDDEQEEIMEEEEESRRKDSRLGQARICAHCLSLRTPQWRAGPLGPKTLCNACGVRFKSGRLLPEYRPAKSPSFVSYKHSNSHKKVLEMRMMSNLPPIHYEL